METHVELKTNSKMFCGCKNDPFGAEKPNIHTCPVCFGMPGGLPLANKRAIEWTVKIGLALNCKVSMFSKFDRKHYFYPDLAKSYQISQYDLPFCYDGYIDTSEGRVRIHRIHLEEDTAKLIHKTVDGERLSLIDFNRSGVPLLEIVTEADIHTPAQAAEYGRKLRQLLRYLDVADCNMQEGGMRLEANISLKEGSNGLPNYKVEVKNINSFKFVESAITYEMDRQAKILSSGKKPEQETRGWNAQKSVTFSQRSKEDAEDYRYFPDPDIPPIRFAKEYIEDIRNSLPDSPDRIIKNWRALDIDTTFIDSIIESQAKVQLFSTLLERLSTHEKVTNILTPRVQNAVTPRSVSKALINKKIKNWTEKTSDEIIEELLELGSADSVSDEALTAAIDAVLKKHDDAVAKYKGGEKKVIGFLMGQVMRELKTKADPAQVRSALSTALS